VSYNLLEERWIPVLGTDGKACRVGITAALTQAGTIRQIAASNPMDNVSLLRLLLAVLQWCKPSLGDREHDGLRSAHGIPTDWLTHRLGTEDQPNLAFDLLDDEGGFYQDPCAGGRKVAVTNLLHDLPSGSKIAHFRHARDGRDGMCLGCCAMGLARWPGVASAGTAGRGQSMTASINGNAPAYSIPIGPNLLATFLLTWPSGQTVEGDVPVWEGASQASPLGFLKGMTWRSRSVLLAPPDAEGRRALSPGRCCQCGERTNRMVRSIIFRPGWRRPSKEPWPEDPHLLRVAHKPGPSAKGKEKKIVPSWPSPNNPLEDHVGMWRSVLKGLLQRAGGAQTSATQFHTTLLATSQALYKQAGGHVAALPGLGPGIAHRLLSEMEWLSQCTWATTSARGRNWRDPPKGHRVVETLCARGAKGHAIRSGLCALSVTAERALEKAFQNLMRGLATVGHIDGESQAQILTEWRDEALEVLRDHVGRVVDATIAGSPLRRREAAQRAQQALREVMRNLAQGDQEARTPDAADKPKRSRRKRGTA